MCRCVQVFLSLQASTPVLCCPVLSPCSQSQSSIYPKPHHDGKHSTRTSNPVPPPTHFLHLRQTSPAQTPPTPIATPSVSRRPSVTSHRTLPQPHLAATPDVLSGPLAAYPPTPCQRPYGCDPATNANESSRLPSLPLSQLALTLRPPSQPWLVTLEVPAQSRSASFLFLLRLVTTCRRTHPPSLDPSPFGCFRRHIGARLPNPPTTPHHNSNHVHNHEPTLPRKLSWSFDNNLATSITDTSTLHHSPSTQSPHHFPDCAPESTS